ncbi:HSF-type DNA-binding protein [Achlya hypogyna]|uniref:HSF-type DNA-binding protein n=1 Tax=Achlya hypogyna TaxID=1202772 RepID=A0A1V9Z8H0_ACHHY|nr:HSF-type DNA-binding protein [Achlya hypogyna]
MTTPPQQPMAPFIHTLVEMLRSGPTCLHWGADGRSFDILDIKVFAKVVLPTFFRHSKFTSFQRQLNYFSFRKQSRRQSAVCTYAHASLSLRVPAEAAQIKRKTVKERSRKARSDDSKTKAVLAYTEASLAYSQALLKPSVIETEPLPLTAGDVGDLPLLDDDMTSWLITQFGDHSD